jgi:short-subunit dehydrogenase
MELDGKTVPLTGATGGLGRAIARAVAGRGARLVLSSRKANELSELAGSLPGSEHETVVADLAVEGEAERAVAAAGDVDALIANAGLPASGLLEDFSPEELARAIRVNLEAPVRMARALAPALRDRGAGHLVFISSLAGKTAQPRSSVYAATKFGLRGFALALREDLWDSGVGVSLVLPGFIRDAGMFADSGAKLPRGVGTSTPDDVGAGVVDAIERNRGEVEVAPILIRLGAGFAHRRPHLAARVTRGNSSRVAENMARGQSDKR